MKKTYEEKLADCRIHNNLLAEREWFLRAIKLIAEIKQLEGKRIADFGCSGCQFLTLLSNQITGEFWGGDIATNAVTHATKLGFKGFYFNADDLTSLPEELIGYFDIVTCLESIEHVNDVDSYFQLLRKSLKPSGFAVITVPNIIFIKFWLHALKGGIPWKEGHHFRFFNRARIQQYIILNGFKVIRENHQIPVKALPLKPLAYINKNNFNSLFNNLPIVDFGFLLQRDENFIPIGNSEHFHGDIEVPIKYVDYMKKSIQKNLVGKNCIGRQTKEYLFRLIG